MSYMLDGIERRNTGGKGLPQNVYGIKKPRFPQNEQTAKQCKRENDIDKLCKTLENVTKKIKVDHTCGDFSLIERYMEGLGYLIDGKKTIAFDLKTVRSAAQIRNHINIMVSELSSLRQRMDKMLDNSFENYFKNLNSKQTVKEAVQKRLKHELQKTLKSIDENNYDDDDDDEDFISEKE